MKKNLLSIVSGVAVLTAFVGSVEAASVSTMNWPFAGLFNTTSSANQASNYQAPTYRAPTYQAPAIRTSAYRAPSTGSYTYGAVRLEPVELASGFGANPSSATSYQADYDRLWNYYNSDKFVKGYQDAYRAALVKRGFDPSYADSLTPTQIKSSTAATFAKSGYVSSEQNTSNPLTQLTAKPTSKTTSSFQSSSFSGSPTVTSTTGLLNTVQFSAGVFPGTTAAAGLQPIGYYVGQTAPQQLQQQVLGQPSYAQFQNQDLGQLQYVYSANLYGQQIQQPIQQQVLVQPQQAIVEQQGFIQPSYVQSNAGYVQYQNQLPLQQQVNQQFTETQSASGQSLSNLAQNVQVSETTTTTTSLTPAETVVQTAAVVTTPTVETSTTSYGFSRNSGFQPQGYISARFGVNKMFESKFADPASDFIALNHKIGYGGSLAAGMYLNRMSSFAPSGLRAEVEVAMLQAAAEEVTTSLVGTPTVPTGDRRILAGMFNLAYDAGTGTSLVPYFGVGIGAAKITADDYTYGGLTLTAPDEIAIAAQVFGGMKYKLTNNMSIDVGGRYLAALKAINGTNGVVTEEELASVVEGTVGVTLSF